MPLDPRFVIAPSLEEYFVDKDTGLPLAGGFVYFWEDNSRTVPKSVYTISGSPPNYTYVELPNPSVLSAVGTFQDFSGNNILPYYFPFDGTPNNTTNTVDLYFIQVYSSGLVFQFSREGWPNVAATGEAAQEQENLISNGQFLAHNNTPNSGLITQATTPVAPGGWYFERPSGSTSVDNVTFGRFNSIVDIPSANPRYFITVSNTTPSSGDAFKYLSIRFPNVNMFSSSTDKYTFGIYGQSNSSSAISLPVYIVKYFGVGGSSFTPVQIGTLNLTTSYEIFSLNPFVFGSDDGYILGAGDDDYVEIAIAFPTNSQYNVSFTDAILVLGSTTITGYPYQTNDVTLSEAVTGYMPTPDPSGLDYYLPLVNTPTGTTWDDGSIGTVVGYSYSPSVFSMTSQLTDTNGLLADGKSYITANYSMLSIPFSRLQKKYYNTTINQPIYGTGLNFVSSYIMGSSTSQIYLSTNTFGTVTAPADGSAMTGFTFFPVTTGSSTGFNINGFSAAGSIFWGIATVPGHVTVDPTAGTTTFTPTTYVNPSDVSVDLAFYFNVVTGSSIVADEYFTFQSLSAPSTQNSYYVWFKVNGSGTDPAPGGTGILCSIESTFTANDINNICAATISGSQITAITTVAGSALTGGDFWTFSTPPSNNFAVWYTVDGAGTQPSASGITYIKCAVLSTDTAAQVATKTVIALNNYSYAVPNYADQFLRGFTPTNVWDLDSSLRFGYAPGVAGNMLGTFELYQVQSHFHVYVESLAESVAEGTGGATNRPTTNANEDTTSYGGVETRPVNANVYWVIKY